MSTCVGCGEQLTFEEGDSMRIIEFSKDYLDTIIRDLAKIDPKIAAEVNIHDGILTLHEDCEHEVEQYLYFKDE